MDARFSEYHMHFIAGEIGRAVIQLAEQGEAINKNSIISVINDMCTTHSNIIYKGLLHDAAEVVGKGK